MVMVPSTAQLPHSGASGSKMTPIQAREELQRRGLPLTAENLNRMMAASYGMDDVPMPNGSASEGQMIDTSIADTDEQRASQPPTPPQRPSARAVSMPDQLSSAQPGKDDTGLSFKDGNKAVDNISPSDPADTGGSGGGMTMQSAPAPQPQPGQPTVNLGNNPTAAPYQPASEVPSAFSAAGGADDMISSIVNEVADRLFNRGATIDPSTLVNPTMPTVAPVMQEFMRMLQSGGPSAPSSVGPVAQPNPFNTAQRPR